MTTRTKYKLGQRVLFTDEDGLENLATITGITTEITTNGVNTIYKSNTVSFEESQIVGIVSVWKPRVRSKKSLGRTGATPGATISSTTANGAA